MTSQHSTPQSDLAQASRVDDAANLLERVRSIVNAPASDAATVLDEVTDLLSHRRRSHAVYQKPLG